MIDKPFIYCWFYGLSDYRQPKYWLWTIENWFNNLRHARKWFKWFLQRGSRGWADCDCWNMNYYLIDITIPMLKKLKESGCGYPDVEGAKTPEEWGERIDEMVEAFEAAWRVLEDEYSIDDVDWGAAVFNPTPEISEEVRKAVHKSIKMSKADQKIFDRKVKVFVKWFYHLWD